MTPLNRQTREAVAKAIAAAVAKRGSRRAWAREHGLDESVVRAIERGALPPSKAALDALGLTLVLAEKQ